MTAGMVLSIKGQPDTHLTFTDEVPKEVMDAYEQVVGNGLAKVSVSADMSIKDFGTGASAMVSITLSCNQDERTIVQAVNLAGGMARYFAKENRQHAETELQGIIQQRQQPAGSATRPNYG